MGWNLPEQLAGSSSRSGHNRGAAVESDVKRMQTGKRIEQGAAAEAEGIGEQQLCTESCPAPDYSRRRTRGEVAEQVKLLVMISSKKLLHCSKVI